MSQRRGSTFAGFGSSTEASGGRSCAAVWWASIRASACSISPRIRTASATKSGGTIAFEPRDQLSLSLNTSALVENIRLADLDRRLGLCAIGLKLFSRLLTKMPYSAGVVSVAP